MQNTETTIGDRPAADLDHGSAVVATQAVKLHREGFRCQQGLVSPLYPFDAAMEAPREPRCSSDLDRPLTQKKGRCLRDSLGGKELDLAGRQQRVK